MKFPVYFDHNATTPCEPQVVEAMLPWFTERFGNASSVHHPFGWIAEEAVEMAREQVAELIGAKSEEVIFTSGATESVNLGIRAVMESDSRKGNHLVAVATEHKAVLDTCEAVREKGVSVTYLEVGKDGLIDLEGLASAIRSDTAMIIVMLANNETGVIQPISEIGVLAKKQGIVFLSDAAQAAGKIPLDVKTLNMDLMPLSAHKMYGPKGVGALYINKSNSNMKLVPQISGGGQEMGFRSGTLNVSGIVGFGKAAEMATLKLDADQKRLMYLRDKLETGMSGIEGVIRNGHPTLRLPHVSHVSFEGVNGKELLIAVNKELAVSSGSACSSITARPSHVLTAMGIGGDLARSSLRFGLGRSTTEEQVEFAIGFVRETIIMLRARKKRESEYFVKED